MYAIEPLYDPRCNGYCPAGGVVFRLIEVIFLWMFEDERWRYKMLFQSLLLLVPVVGQVALLGWTMATYDSLVTGGQDLAHWGLHLRRGVRLLAIGVLYWLALGITYSGVRDLDALTGHTRQGGIAVQLYNDLALLLFALLLVPLVAATAERGLLGGLDLPHLARSIAAHPLRTAGATMVTLVAGCIALIGIALIIAAPFLLTYAAAVTASAAAWWSAPLRRPEREAGTASQPDGAMPAPFRPPHVEARATRPPRPPEA